MPSGTGKDMNIPDAEQRRRALDPQRSFIVQARPVRQDRASDSALPHPAGVVDQPEAVVAITLHQEGRGRDAAACAGALRDSAGSRPEKEHEQRTWELAKTVRERSDSLNWNLFSNSSACEFAPSIPSAPR